MNRVITPVGVQRSRQVYEGVFDVDSPGGTLLIGESDCAPGALQNFLRWPPTTLQQPLRLRIDLTKISPTGGALGKPVVAFTPVGNGTRLDITWDDPGLGVTERWVVRIEDPFSPTR